MLLNYSGKTYLVVPKTWKTRLLSVISWVTWGKQHNIPSFLPSSYIREAIIVVDVRFTSLVCKLLPFRPCFQKARTLSCRHTAKTTALAPDLTERGLIVNRHSKHDGDLIAVSRLCYCLVSASSGLKRCASTQHLVLLTSVVFFFSHTGS